MFVKCNRVSVSKDADSPPAISDRAMRYTYMGDQRRYRTPSIRRPVRVDIQHRQDYLGHASTFRSNHGGDENIDLPDLSTTLPLQDKQMVQLHGDRDLDHVGYRLPSCDAFHVLVSNIVPKNALL